MATPLMRGVRVKALLKKIDRMPWLPQAITVACLLIGVLFILLPAIPGVTIRIDGLEISYAEYWSSRISLEILGTGILLFGVGIWMLRKFGR